MYQVSIFKAVSFALKQCVCSNTSTLSFLPWKPTLYPCLAQKFTSELNGTQEGHRCYSTLYKRSLLMNQFEKIKKQYNDFVLLFQVGEFYELYGDDATNVASKTSLRLTKKQNSFMAGFPVKSLNEWQRTLVEAGFQLAICDQVTPSQDNQQGKTRLLGRQVVKLVTPGTLIEPLNNSANYLMSIATGPGEVVGISWVDISTGEFQVSSSSVSDVDEDLERVCPSEVLLPEESVLALKQGRTHQLTHPAARNMNGLMKSSLLKECHLTGVPQSWFTEQLLDNCDNDKRKQLDIYRLMMGPSFSALEVTAANALLRYVLFTQKNLMPHITGASRFSHVQHMAIDANTRRALEVVTNTRKATLLGSIDRTVTAAGGRLLKTRLSCPLLDVHVIRRRLAAVELFSAEVFHAENIVALLKSCEDLERIIQKVATGSTNISDLQAIKSTLRSAGEILNYVEQNVSNKDVLSDDMEGLVHFPGLIEELDNALSGDSYGDFIMEGYSDNVDQLRQKIKQNEGKLNELVQQLRDDYNLTKLTVAPHRTYVRVFEVTKSHVAKAEKCKKLFIVDGTQSKARFSHIELQKLNAELQQLEMSYCNAQDQLFKDLCAKVLSQADEIKGTALSLARLDVSSSLGLLANERGYCKPDVVDEAVFNVEGGIHPVVASLQQSTFVSNDCDMSEHRLWIVTGPNMGGKSTFLRQNALIAILAQMGCFVPADRAKLGVVDCLFARIGASDNVAKHISTFHMEMSETANILTHATDRSFIILDEIGRGTSTSEGLSIAQAVIEHLHNKIGSRTLVATHFHQLVDLSPRLPNVGCYKLVAESSENGIIFTYQIKPGHVDHSFALEVARLAGVPAEVIARAKELHSSVDDDHNILTLCQVSNEGSSTSTAHGQHELLNHQQREVIKSLRNLSLDSMSPIESLNVLNQLKQHLDDH